MAARAAAAQAARRHLAASAIGFAAAVAVAKAFMVPQQSLSEVEADAGEGKRELQLVQVVFRHGARTPLGQKYWPELGPKWDVCGKAYDAVPIHVTTEDGRPRPVNLDDQKQVEQRYEGGCSKGELTLVGQQQALEFGRWLRWRYAMVHALLPHAHQEGAVVARTTNYSRTVATLQGVLTGLHPGTAAPIPVHTTEEIDEILYTNVKSCKRLHTLMQQLHRQQRDAAEQGGDPGVEAVQQRVRSALGLPPDHRVSFVDLHDAMTSMQTHGKAIPEGMRDEQLLREVDRLATQRFMHVVAPPPNTGKTQEVLRLGMGVLMETMVRRMEAAAAGAGASGAGPSPAAGTPTSAASSSGAGDAASGSTSSSGDDGAGRAEGSTDSGTGGTGGGTAPRMYLYSGHDSSLMPLLAALGQPVQDWPPYLSSLALELWRQPSGKHYVKVLYNRKELPLTQLCGTPACELQTFREKVIGPYLLTRDQHKQECLLHFMHDQPAGEHTETEEVSVGSSFQEEADSGRQGGKGDQGNSRERGKGDHGSSQERSQGDQEKKTEPPRAAAEGG